MKSGFLKEVRGESSSIIPFEDQIDEQKSDKKLSSEGKKFKSGDKPF